MEAGNSIVVDVLIALLKEMDITKYGINDGNKYSNIQNTKLI